MCPGEHTSHYAHVSTKQREKIEKKPLLTAQLPFKNEQRIAPAIVFKTKNKNRQNKSTVEKQKYHRVEKDREKKSEDEEADEDEKMKRHRPSLWAFNMFCSISFLGVIGFAPAFFGLIWAIRNLFFLRFRKEEYKWKGFSLSIVFAFAGFSLIAMLVLVFQLLNGAFFIWGAELFVMGFFFALLMLCVITLVFYYAEIHFYSQSE